MADADKKEKPKAPQGGKSPQGAKQPRPAKGPAARRSRDAGDARARHRGRAPAGSATGSGRR